MKPPPFAYARPTSIGGALTALSNAGEGAAVISGGQSLLPLLGLRMASATSLIDIGRIPELRGFHESAGHVRIGAAITHADIEDGKAPDPGRGLMRRVAGGIAYRAVRNQGTIGGSVAMADPAADWPVCLMALGATARIVSHKGERAELVERLIQDTYTTTLTLGEVIVAFDIPWLDVAARTGFAKVSRKTGAFAMSLAVAIANDGARAARVVLGGAGGRARPLASASREMQNGAGTPALRVAIAADLADIGIVDEYDLRLHSAVALRAIEETRR